jgi:uncharacterized membrane protein
MAKPASRSLTCEVCGNRFARHQLVPAGLVRDGIANEIRRSHPEWSPDGYICLADLNRYRDTYVRSLIAADKGELSTLEHEVLESLLHHETLAVDVEEQFDARAKLGERLADRVADFGGSWTFILIFFGILVLWMVINAGFLIARPFDPYPYIFLNLMLSCLAAVQAPVIMMSQNRQEARDRLRSKSDYQINLKAELEIRQLHEKLDHLLRRQWERLMEIQEIQIELMSELRERNPGGDRT